MPDASSSTPSTWISFLREHLRVRGLRPEREAEIVEDLARQLDDAYREALAMGANENEARAAAERHIADWDVLNKEIAESETRKMAQITQWQQRAEERDLRKRGRFTWITDIRQDVLYALRVLRKSPGFTAIAVLTLGLGIGANTAIFSLIDAVMLRSLPVVDPASLVVLEWSARETPHLLRSHSDGDCPTKIGGANPVGCSLSKPFLEDVQTKADVFSGLAEFASGGRLNLSGDGPASLVNTQYVSGDYFRTLGIGAALGRTIEPADDSSKSEPVVVLNYLYWKNSWGADPSVVGKIIHLNGLPFTIAGVAEPRFVSLTPGAVYDIWIPLAERPRLLARWTPRQDEAAAWWLAGVGRLKPGVSRAQAQASVSLLFFNELVHGDKPLSQAEDAPAINLVPVQSGLTGARRALSAPLYVLMAAVGVVLLIACANVAGLLLARANSRQREIAVRLALGAGRARIVRQLLTESVTLSLGGGVLGILVAFWSAPALLAFMSSASTRPSGFSAQIDFRVLAFTIGASLFTGILFGLAPALRSMRVDLTPALKEGAGKGSRTSHGGRSWLSAGNMLVVAQVALTVVVLVGAGLLVRTLENLKNVDPGFATENILNFGVDSTLTGYKGARLAVLYNDLRDRFSGIPGVLAASYSESTLLSGSRASDGFHIPGTGAMTLSVADYLPIGPNFFQTMRIGVVSGRDFTAAEFLSAAESAASMVRISQTAAPAIVNEAFARAYFPKVDVAGKIFGADTDEMEAKSAADNLAYRRNPGWVIVGVVRDAKYNSLRRDVKPTVYVPSGLGGAFELRTAGNPMSVISAVREVVRQVGSDMPIFDVKTESKQIDDLLYQERLIARMSGLFAIVALLLACIGLYGLLSYEVTRRTQEIGIRMALGAQASDAMRSMIRRGVGLAAAGAAIGTAVSFGVTPYLGTFLFNVKPGDPATLIGVIGLLLVVALAACWVPAHRATKVDPLIALRYE
jgi:predicted permease